MAVLSSWPKPAGGRGGLGPGRRRPRGPGPGRGQLPRPPLRPHEGRRRHRDQGQDHDDLHPRSHPAARPAPSPGVIGTIDLPPARLEVAAAADDARVLRPAGPAPRDARRRRQPLRHGGLLPRPRAEAGLAASASTSPSSPTSAASTSTTTRTMEAYFEAKKKLFFLNHKKRRGGRQLGRPLGPAAGRRAAHDARSTFGLRAGGHRPGRQARDAARPASTPR
ncbi:MAG: hypothetical protein MZU95_04815 [Desulfomicrobium escambiense]|nr:hypothetical protein [Desulfomicrobium escambiense]